MNISVPTTATALENSSKGFEPHCPPEAQHVFLTVLLCLVYLLGLLLNGYSLWVFTCKMAKWRTGTVLQFNLAISDAIACPATPLMAAYFANGSNWEFGRFACQLKIALLSAHFYGSIMFLTLISIHRYVMVVQIKQASPMKRKSFVKKLCVGVWCFLLVKAIIYGILLPVTNEEGHKQCLSIHQKNLTDAYFVINFLLFIFGFIIPFAISVACYSRLARSLSRLKVDSAQSQAIKVKSMRMIGVCLIIFGLCFLPLNVVRTVGVVVKKYYPTQCQLLLGLETAYYASYILGGINCCLDPLIYFFGSHHFSRALRKSLSRKKIHEQERNTRSESETVSYSAKRSAVYTIST
ncbi:P2Y purinoceptor 4-like [Salminus brasiliensis]|uniref:P2Y purinoceptor 4-like n=1 Tax=Salminus brasiliensis TaxID=930266 RepID=UPI003B834B06